MKIFLHHYNKSELIDKEKPVDSYTFSTYNHMQYENERSK